MRTGFRDLPRDRGTRLRPDRIDLPVVRERCGGTTGVDEGGGELRLDATPAVVGRSGEVTVELPVTPAVASLVFAVIGMVISLVTVAITARRVRAAQRR